MIMSYASFPSYALNVHRVDICLERGTRGQCGLAMTSEIAHNKTARGLLLFTIVPYSCSCTIDI